MMDTVFSHIFLNEIEPVYFVGWNVFPLIYDNIYSLHSHLQQMQLNRLHVMIW